MILAGLSESADHPNCETIVGLMGILLGEVYRRNTIPKLILQALAEAAPLHQGHEHLAAPVHGRGQDLELLPQGLRALWACAVGTPPCFFFELLWPTEGPADTVVSGEADFLGNQVRLSSSAFGTPP